MRVFCTILLLLLLSLFLGTEALAVSVNKNPLFSFLFPPPVSPRDQLKTELLAECFGDNVDRVQLESVIFDLAKLSPIQATASSKKLQKKWNLIWTSEKEINFFIDRGITTKEGVTQEIRGNVLKNGIEFVNGGGLFVSGKLQLLEQDGKRTNFAFDSATLDLQWIKIPFPPIGKGYFDTIYLDDDLRIDTNSRNDILICQAEKAAQK